MAINQTKWDVDVSQNPPRPMSITLMHGEDVGIAVSYYLFGTPLDLSGASATFLFQKISASGDTWYTLPMVISGDDSRNIASVEFTKAYDDGETDYKFYVQIVLEDSQTFRAFGQIRYLPSPYLAATELPESMYGALRFVGDFADGDMLIISGDSGELARSGGKPVSVADVSGIVSDAVADGVSDGVSEHDIDTEAHADIRGEIDAKTDISIPYDYSDLSILSIEPGKSYAWVCNGACAISADSGWLPGHDQACSIIVTPASGTTISGDGVTLIDAPEIGVVNHCFVRNTPTGLQMYVAYFADGAEA